jgi:glycine hydroxymethyltransferase
LEHAIAAKAVAFKEAAQANFSVYTDQIVANARAFGSALAHEGFRMVSGGTENHMVLLDLHELDAELTGKVAQEVLDRAGITTNRNTIPDDPRSAFITSGLRVGTAAETTAGLKEGEFATVAALMARALRGREDEQVIADVRGDVAELCSTFNPYANFSK